jgi:hypothetical protein
MPVFSSQGRRSITPTLDAPDQGRAGKIPRQNVMIPKRGIPRFEDLLSIRVLERSPTIALPMNTIRTQVTTPEWGIRPTVEDPSPEHKEAADELETFFDGGFNPNEQKFSNLLKLWVTDILSIDAGTLELVPTEPDNQGTRWLGELWHLDSVTMVKELNEHGEIPRPPEPAYYQFAPRNAVRGHWTDVLQTLTHGQGRFTSVLQSYSRQQHRPIPFSRDQVVWLERNPQSATRYGFGKVQQVRHWAEILLNVDVSNSSYFSDNEIPQGIMHINAGSQQELNRARDYLRDTIKGQTDHIAPMFDARSSEDIGWVPIQGTPEELQFLDSQQWYHKLVWFLFGLNQGEIGDFESGNRSMGEYHARQIYRQTTKPLLDDMLETINGQILPKMEAYQRVDGELEMFVDTQHEQMQELERQRQTEDLRNAITTPNAIRRDRGKEEVPWGDVPIQVVEEVSRKHPEWALEQWGDVDPDDVPDESPFGDVFSAGSQPSTESPADGSPDGGESQSSVEAEESEADSGNATPAWERRQDEDAGEIADEFPALADLIPALETDVDRTLRSELDAVLDDVEERWPDDGTQGGSGLAVDLDDFVDDLQLQDELTDAVVEHSAAAMQAAADDEAQRLEEDLEERFGLVDEVAQVDLDFDLTSTFAFEKMRRRAARNMVSVEDSVKELVRHTLLEGADEGWGVSEMTDRLDSRIDEISRERSRLVSRTELPQASRDGTQALGEATDVVGGKDWIPTSDGRTRPWHDAMSDVEPIPVDDSWTVPSGWQGEPHYQPTDYPRVAHTAGEDQPFNCRCLQQNVLEEDMPDDVRNLADWAGVTVRLQLTNRQFEVWQDRGQAGESMRDLLERVDESYSRNSQAPEYLGVDKKTLYSWLKEFDLY